MPERPNGIEFGKGAERPYSSLGELRSQKLMKNSKEPSIGLVPSQVRILLPAFIILDKLINND